MLRRPAVLLQMGLVFGLLSAAGIGFCWQCANAAQDKLALAIDLTAPLQELRVDIETSGSWDVVLLTRVIAHRGPKPPPVRQVLAIRPRLSGAAGDITWAPAVFPDALDDDRKPMLLRLGSFVVTAPGEHRLSLSYEAAQGGPAARMLFGHEVKRSAEDIARWTFAILLVAVLGGCLTFGSLLMGLFLRFAPTTRD